MKELPAAVQNVLFDMMASEPLGSSAFKNRQRRLPEAGARPPHYIEYDVPTPGSKGPGGRPNRGDRRIVRDTANDLYYYSGNFHAKDQVPHAEEGSAANFIEILDMPANLPY